MKSTFLRDHERYGDVILSVQANEFAYCIPRADLPNLDQYEAVEVAMWIKNDRRDFFTPSKLGLPEDLDDHWEERGVCGYYSQENLALLRAALRERAKGVKPEVIARHHAARREVARIN